MTTREAWERVTAKREEHQTAAGLQATSKATRDDHSRAGMQWLEAVCREHGLDIDDVLGTMVAAQADTTPNLRALVAIGALGPGELPEACFGGGFFTGLTVGLEVKRA